MKIAYLLISTVLIIAILCGFIMLIEVIKLYTMSNRIEDLMIYSGWSAFSKIDLDILSERKYISDEEDRNVYLDETEAKKTVLEHLKKNLKIDDSFKILSQSFIPQSDYPVLIDLIEIYNPDSYPTTAPNGVDINRTSVYISLQFPLNIKFVGDVYKKLEVIVDTKTFYSQYQN